MGRSAHGLQMKVLLEWEIRNEKLEMVVRRKNSEAPQNFDSASRRRHRKRSRVSSLQNGQYANCATSITSCS